MYTRLHLTALCVALLAACSSEDGNELSGGPGGSTSDQPPGPGGDQPPTGTVDPATCGGKTFAGFEGENLVADRVVANAGVDRGRFKPYDALATEYARVLGTTPASLAEAADTFGKPEPRWYDEPAVGGVVLQTAYKIAFDGCLTYTQGPAEFAAAPTAATADAQCAAMTRKFWSRTASPDQIAACSDVAVNGAAAETNPRRRWAYACASVLSAAGFMTY
jgi:hypothetical protein